MRRRLLWAYGLPVVGAGNLHGVRGRDVLVGWRNGLHRDAVPPRSVRNLRGGEDCRRGSLPPPAVGHVQRLDGHTVQTEPS
jgi:hypothetical protein